MYLSGFWHIFVKMEIVLQDHNSKVCGQCCIAMILGITLDKAIKLVGHEKATTALELSKALCVKKIFIRISKNRTIPERAILFVGNIGNRRHRHWVVIENQKIYCPTFGIFDSLASYLTFSKQRATSILKIS